MKTKRISVGAAVLLGSAGLTLAAQSARNFAVVERNAHSKVMQSVRVATNSAGQSVNITNRYTVLGNGMNKQDAAGNWVECVPVVRSFPSGIVCTGANYRVLLKPNLNRQGSVDYEGSDGLRIVSHPLAIAYFDPESGQRVWLSQISDCQAQVVSNKVIYANAFTNGGLEAAVIYHYGRGQFHQNVVLTKKPAASPADLGMGTRTRLEIVTEIVQAPNPAKTNRFLHTEKDVSIRSRMTEPDLIDETLIFSPNVRMPLGFAFPNNVEEGSQTRRIPVAKRLRTMASGRTVLIESVEWTKIRAELDKLPRRFAAIAYPIPETLLAADVPARPAPDGPDAPFEKHLAQTLESGPVQIVGLTAKEPEGLVVDYQILGSAYSPGTGTYLVEDSEGYMSGSLGGDIVIKFRAGGCLRTGNFAPQGGNITLTSADDDSVGEIIEDSTGVPSGYYGYFQIDGDISDGFGNLDCRYMTVGIDFTYANQYITRGGWIFRHCGVGLRLSAEDLVFLGSSDNFQVCDVETPVEGVGSSYSPTISEANCWDLDSNGLGDDWERQNFGRIGQDPSGDPDGDGLPNWVEQQADTNPNVPDPLRIATHFENLFANQQTVTGTCEILSGVPWQMAVLVNNTNITATNWQGYSSNFSVTLGSTDGVYSVLVAVRSYPTNIPVQVDFTELTLDRVAPELTFTNPIVVAGAATVMKPYLQLQGFGNEPLASLTYDITNATNWRTNEFAAVVDQFFDTNLFDFTTNYFQAYDVELTNGLNQITLSVKDRAGNVTVTNLNVTLSYAGATNPPTLQVTWPPADGQVSGNSFYLRGKISDETAGLVAQVIGGGVTNSVGGIVERNGLFWVENLPLAAGTSGVTLIATDAAGNVRTTNFNVVKSTVALAITSRPDGSQLYNSVGTVSGTVSDASYSVSVNEVSATVETDGSWTADNVPIRGLGTAAFDLQAMRSGDPVVHRSEAVEMPPVLMVASHFMRQVISQPGTTATWQKSFTQSQEVSGGLPRLRYHGTALQMYYDDYGWSGVDYDWSDNDANGTYHSYNSLGGSSSGVIQEGRVMSLPDTQVDHIWTEGNSTMQRAVTHSFARGVRHEWPNGSTWTTVETFGAHTRWTLYTGGKATVNRKALHWIGVGPLIYGKPEGTPWYYTPTYVPPFVTVNGKPTGSDGRAYFVWPDNAPINVDINVAGAKHAEIMPGHGKHYLIHLTQCAALIDPNPERLNLGVGEEVDFSLEGLQMTWPEQPQWEVLGAGTVSPQFGSSTLFTAPSMRTLTSVRVWVRDVQLQESFFVLEPSGVEVTKRSLETFTPGDVGAGMHHNVVLQPMNVSFGKVEIIEPAEPTTGIEGFFSYLTPPTHEGNGAGIWRPVNCGNLVMGPPINDFDVAGWKTSAWPEGQFGKFTWPINARWRVEGTSTDYPLSGWTGQKVIVETSGAVTVQKFGHQIRRLRGQYEGIYQ